MKHYKLNFTKKDLQDWLKGEVDFLRENEDYSGSYYKLHSSSIYENEDLAAVICWEPGFGEEHRDDCIQSKEEPDWALCVGVKIYNPSDTCDAWDSPIDEDTNDVLCGTISLDESDITDKFSHIADYIINSYEECLAYYEEQEDEDDELEESKIKKTLRESSARYQLEYWPDEEARDYGLGDIYGVFASLESAKRVANRLFDDIKSVGGSVEVQDVENENEVVYFLEPEESIGDLEELTDKYYEQILDGAIDDIKDLRRQGYTDKDIRELARQYAKDDLGIKESLNPSHKLTEDLNADDNDIFYQLRNIKKFLNEYNFNNIYSDGKTIKPIPNDLVKNKFSVSCEQARDGVFMSKEELESFKREYNGDYVVFWNADDSEWGGEYSIIVPDEEDAVRATIDYNQDGYACYDESGNYKYTKDKDGNIIG